MRLLDVGFERGYRAWSYNLRQAFLATRVTGPLTGQSPVSLIASDSEYSHYITMPCLSDKDQKRWERELSTGILVSHDRDNDEWRLTTLKPLRVVAAGTFCVALFFVLAGSLSVLVSPGSLMVKLIGVAAGAAFILAFVSIGYRAVRRVHAGKPVPRRLARQATAVKLPAHSAVYVDTVLNAVHERVLYPPSAETMRELLHAAREDSAMHLAERYYTLAVREGAYRKTAFAEGHDIVERAEALSSEMMESTAMEGTQQ